MRKSLTIHVNTMEKGEEISISSVYKNEAFVLISAGGLKVTASAEELEKALIELKEFNAQNVQENLTEVVEQFTIEYGE